jgi:2,3-bisphosphoglycerate-dependent phosphoglycerate mutase
MSTLIMLRHGQSTWNKENLFTGWEDVDLTEQGEQEARRGGELLLESGVLPDVVHTSLQKRAIRTATLALEQCDRSWIPTRRSWRLNERHYGDLQGKNKAKVREQYGDKQLVAWRRGYRTPPPPLDWDPAGDPRYAELPPDVLPKSECLADVVDRMLPYWYDGIVPDLVAGRATLVAAHGNSLRGLVKHLDAISDDDIVDLNIPTGQPLVYELDERLEVVGKRYLDPEAAEAAAEAVRKQAG